MSKRNAFEFRLTSPPRGVRRPEADDELRAAQQLHTRSMGYFGSRIEFAANEMRRLRGRLLWRLGVAGVCVLVICALFAFLRRFDDPMLWFCITVVVGLFAFIVLIPSYSWLKDSFTDAEAHRIEHSEKNLKLSQQGVEAAFDRAKGGLDVYGGKSGEMLARMERAADEDAHQKEAFQHFAYAELELRRFEEMDYRVWRSQCIATAAVAMSSFMVMVAVFWTLCGS